jgi:hypothetical protein
MEISNAISSEKSKSKSQLNLVIDNNTENISMSDLELLANKNKVNKPELLVSDIISEKKLESHRKTSSKSKSKSKTKKERHYTTNTTDSLDTTAYQKDKLRKINKENKNEKIRFQKNKLLYDISQLNIKGNVSLLKLDMNSSLDEIEREYNRIKTNKNSEIMVNLCKKGLLIGVQGLEVLNNSFDPLGVDLDGWGESMSYQLENRDFDEVLRELYEKYKGQENVSPEFKLFMLIVGSCVMFGVNKKIKNVNLSDSNNFLGNIINSFMPKQQPPQQQFTQQQFQQPPQQQFQQPPQQFNQQQFQQQFQQPQFNQQQFQQPPQQFHQQFQQQFQQEKSEDSDTGPSKMLGDIPNPADLANIMKKMDANNLDLDLDTIEIETENQQEKVIKPKRGRPLAKKKVTRS